MTNTHSYTTTLDPSQPLLVHLGRRSRATLHSSRPFRIGATLYAAGHTHNLPEPGSKARSVVVQGVGHTIGTLRVEER